MAGEITVDAAVQAVSDVQGAPAPGPVSEAPAPAAEPVAAPVETKPDPKAAAFAALSRKERAAKRKFEELTAKEAAISAREASLEAQRKAMDERVSKIDTLEHMAKNGHELEALEALGINYNELIKKQITKGAPDPIAAATKAAEKLMSDFLAEQKKSEGEKALARAQAENAAAYSQALNQIKTLVGAGEKYELIAAQGAEQMVLDAMEETWKLTGEAPSFEKALEETEAYLFEQISATVAKSKKLQGIGSKPAEAAPSGELPLQIKDPRPEIWKEDPAIMARVNLDNIRQAREKNPTKRVTINPGAPKTEAPAGRPLESREDMLKRIITQTLQAKV